MARQGIGFELLHDQTIADRLGAFRPSVSVAVKCDAFDTKLSKTFPQFSSVSNSTINFTEAFISGRRNRIVFGKSSGGSPRAYLTGTLHIPR